MLREKIEKTEKLQFWLESLGCKINPKIQYPFEFENGLLGVVAKETINSKEVLTEITQQAIFSTEMLPTSPLQSIFQAHPDLFGKENSEAIDNQFLALILYERCKGGKWDVFFDMFPETIENLCDWNEDELRELQDEDLSEDTRIRVRKNWNAYERLQEVLSGYQEFFPKRLSLDEIEWCWKVIWTRSFMRSPEHSALVPYSDLINHGESSTGFYFSDQNEEEPTEDHQDFDEIFSRDNFIKLLPRDLYEINFSGYENPDQSTFDQAKNVLILADSLEKDRKVGKKTGKTQDIIDPNANFIISVGENEKYEPGQQVFIEYGGYSNTSLLIHYGFALEYNRHEFFRLKLGVNEILTRHQMDFLPLKYDPNAFFLFLINDRGLNKDLITVLRAAQWNPSYSSPAFFNPLNLDLEKRVLTKYLNLVQATLSQFPTSLESDKAALPASPRHCFSVIPIQLSYRINKKRVLTNHLSILRHSLTVLDSLISKVPLNTIQKEAKPYFDALLQHLPT